MLFFKKKKHPKSLSLDVAGTMYRQDALAKCPRDERVLAKLTPEPTNKHDRNAVKVMIGKNFIGYIPRDESARVSELIRDDLIEECMCDVWHDSDDGELVASVKIKIKETP